MSYERKEGDVSIFKNEKTKENQPDYTGVALINGQDMRVALWVKEGKKGKFFSGRITQDVGKIEPKGVEQDDIF